jgi:hypothetical protein
MQRGKLSIGYYLVTLILILLLENLFDSGPAVKELPNSKFRDLIAKKKIERVIIGPDKIYGLLKPEQTSQKTAQ